MSTTFYLDSPVIGSVIECACGEQRSGIYAELSDALDAIKAGTSGVACTDDICSQYALGIHSQHLVDREPPINLASANAALVLDALGLAADPWGQINGDDLAARVLLAQAADAPVHEAAVAAVAPDGGVRSLGARRPGYLQDRLAELGRMAATARETGVDVLWS